MTGLQPLRRLNLNRLYALDAILNARSLTAAGKRVLLSQPAMSLALKKLRDEFGDELVSYSGGERSLTPLAEALRPKVRKILEDVDETFRFKLDFDPATASRTIRISAPDAIEIILLARGIPRLVREAPRVEIQILPFDPAYPLRSFEQGVDMVIMPEHFADPRFPSTPLVHDLLACMVWNKDPSVRRELSKADYMAGRHAAVFDALTSYQHMEAESKSIIQARNIVVRTSQHAGLPGAIIGTDLIATTSCWLAQYYASMMPVDVIPVPFEASMESIVAQWPHHRAGDPMNGWLLDHLLSIGTVRTAAPAP